MTERSTITLCEGDAALVIRGSGETLAVCVTSKPANEAVLTVLGLGLALENEEWRTKLIRRTVEEWRRIKGEQIDERQS